MYDHHYASSTVNTYVSALGYTHKLFDLPDPTKVFFITQMLKGFHKLGGRRDHRLPISLPILHRLISVSDQFSAGSYTILLFKAMCSLAFYALLRVGEMTSGGSEARPPLQLHQLVHMIDDKRKVVALRLVFLDYKHSYNQRPFHLVINRQFSFCPVDILLKYMAVRGSHPGPIFVSATGRAVTRSFFTDLLYLALRFAKYIRVPALSS